MIISSMSLPSRTLPFAAAAARQRLQGLAIALLAGLAIGNPALACARSIDQASPAQAIQGRESAARSTLDQKTETAAHTTRQAAVRLVAAEQSSSRPAMAQTAQAADADAGADDNDDAVQAAIPGAFIATYTVSYRGLRAGTITFTFAHDASSGHYLFEIRPNPSTLARLFVSSRTVERSIMVIDRQGVRPLRWTLDDGTSTSKAGGELHFDWSARRVSGRIETEMIDLPTEAGLQDRSSLQIALSTTLLRGGQPDTIPLIDGNRIKYYSYVLKGSQQQPTPIGAMETLMYESTRPGSSRLSHLWLAPGLDYLPVRAEQLRKGRSETVMELIALRQP